MSIDMKCQMSWDVKFYGAKCPRGTHLLILGIFSNRNWFWTLIPWWIWWLWLLWWLRSPRSHEMLTDMICRPTWNIKYHEMSNVKCHEILVLGPQAETPGVTHFGAYHRPPDGHFYNQSFTTSLRSCMFVCLISILPSKFQWRCKRRWW